MSRIAQLREKFPGFFNELERDAVNEEPVLQYITELDLRADIFREFQRFARAYLEFRPDLNAIALGIIMVAPISQLQAKLEMMRNSSDPWFDAQPIFETLRGRTAVSAIKAFVIKGGPPASGATTPSKRNASNITSPAQSPKRRRSHARSVSNPSVSMGHPSTPALDTSAFAGLPAALSSPTGSRTTRKVEAANSAKERDSHECVLSGLGCVEAAHLFPFSTTEKGNFTNLSIMLRHFWGEEKTEEWRNLFEDTDITESSANLVSLARHAHYWFDNARFALKPLRKTQEGAVIVQFHWLKSSNGLKPYTPVEARQEASPFSDILARAGLSDNDAWGDVLAHRKSGLPLQTGQTFVLGAKNPKKAPSFQLLELSWNLLRVGAISGAAEPSELDDDDDEENDPGFAAYLEEYEQEQWAPWEESAEQAEELENRGRSRHHR